MIEIEEEFRKAYEEAQKEEEIVAESGMESMKVEEKEWKLGMLQLEANINTLYKRKADKVRPINKANNDGSVQKGIENWKEVCLAKYHPERFEYDGEKKEPHFLPRISQFPVGERLTTERLDSIKVGIELRPAEKELLFQMLYCREGALGWEWTEVKNIRPEVMPPMKIRTVDHEA